MIKKDDCRLIGKIAKPHGTKGSLLLWLRDIQAEEIRKRESVFVEIDGLLVPFFIEIFQVNSSESLVIKFEEIDSETKARTLAGFPVYVTSDQLRQKSKSIPAFSSLNGYKVTDARTGFVGIAGDVADIAKNPLLQVVLNGKEYLVPIHEDIVLEINKKTREIRINAPEGLFDL